MSTEAAESAPSSDGTVTDQVPRLPADALPAGTIAGAVLAAARRSASLTEERHAELLGVSPQELSPGSKERASSWEFRQC